MSRIYQGKYGGKIQFREGITMPFSEFFEAYKVTYPFRTMPDQYREDEIKKAYKIATNGNIKPSADKQPKADKGKLDKPSVQDGKSDREGDNKPEPETDI